MKMPYTILKENLIARRMLVVWYKISIIHVKKNFRKTKNRWKTLKKTLPTFFGDKLKIVCYTKSLDISRLMQNIKTSIAVCVSDLRAGLTRKQSVTSKFNKHKLSLNFRACWLIVLRKIVFLRFRSLFLQPLKLRGFICNCRSPALLIVWRLRSAILSHTGRSTELSSAC